MSTPAPARTHELSWIDRYFHITERGSTVGREIRGGIVTFFAMSYILVLNPLILSTPDSTGAYLRSEEHTSELQSRGHLVCRLLLEKKKNVEGYFSSNSLY